MPAAAPTQLEIRTYQVGFGDCFLLSFKYAAEERHVLVDFGSTGLPPGSEGPSAHMLKIAEDIKQRTGGKLHAVVATHRHKDHISGFATSKEGDASGDVIRGLKPDVVVQPWTEDPAAATDAKEATQAEQEGRPSLRKHLQALADMQRVAQSAVATVLRLGDQLSAKLGNELGFVGEDNLANLAAVENLATMSPRREYLSFGLHSLLEEVLPGVTVHVLGPPTLEQSAQILKERSKDQTEFWQFWRKQALASPAREATAEKLFPAAEVVAEIPRWARWFARRAADVHADSLLELVRILDDAMNNTSVILLLEIGDKRILFPGDAQIENWSYALSHAEVRALLGTTNLYKVGHHGSRNATPKASLWPLFTNRSKEKSAARLTTLMSTMKDKFGHAESGTEVPRRVLVEEMDAESNLFSTEDLEKGALFHVHTMTL
jgi:beta-lactamase superfamily II metal-dependent hydrolase